jgi:hypothetical protein
MKANDPSDAEGYTRGSSTVSNRQKEEPHERVTSERGDVPYAIGKPRRIIIRAKITHDQS